MHKFTKIKYRPTYASCLSITFKFVNSTSMAKAYRSSELQQFLPCYDVKEPSLWQNCKIKLICLSKGSTELNVCHKSADRQHFARVVALRLLSDLSLSTFQTRRAGRRAARTWFLKIDPVRTSVCVCVCVCVCPPPRLLITSGVMWCDIDSRRLVKQVL